jgi:hypothetical protein
MILYHGVDEFGPLLLGADAVLRVDSNGPSLELDVALRQLERQIDLFIVT